MYVKTIGRIAEYRNSALQHVHWTRVFTDRINNSTKLVGPTISCEGGSQTSAAARIHSTGITACGQLLLWRMTIGPCA